MKILDWSDSGVRARLEPQDMVDLAYGPGRVEASRPDHRRLAVQVVGLDRVESYLDRLVSAAPEVAPHRKEMDGGFVIFEGEPEVRAEVWIPWPVFERLFQRGSEAREFRAPIRVKLRNYDLLWTSKWRVALEFPPAREYEAAIEMRGSGGARRNS